MFSPASGPARAGSCSRTAWPPPTRVGAAGQAVAAPSVTRRLISHFIGANPTRPAHDERLEALTTREREVLTLITLGRSNQEIAAELHVSTGTVKAHIGHILTKLNLRDRV